MRNKTLLAPMLDLIMTSEFKKIGVQCRKIWKSLYVRKSSSYYAKKNIDQRHVKDKPPTCEKKTNIGLPTYTT